jgi:hypothetical protein
MRKVTVILAVAALMGVGLVNFNDSRLPQAWDLGPGQAFADDTKLEMPKEASGFIGTLWGEVVMPTDQNGCYDIRVSKVLGFGAGNKAKLNAAALTEAWKGKASWCRPLKAGGPKCEPLKVGEMVLMDCVCFEVHLRYTKVIRVEGAKPGDEPPGPVVKRPPSPTSAPAASSGGAASQPAVANVAADKLKLAQLYIDSKMKERARETLQAIIADYPNTDAARQAQAKLKELGG